MPRATRYLVVSPVKDEEKYLGQTLQSVERQTVKPLLWVIVDDGSQDGTLIMAQSFAATRAWVLVHHLERDRCRQPGSAVVQAFNAGQIAAGDVAYDFIVKLDGDVILPPTYFEDLFERFAEDPSLGIASGAYLEHHAKEWVEIRMPDYHAAGASKVIRSECFSQIGGFVPSRGWDTVDEIRAQAHGWRSTHFRDVQFQHLKNEGTGIGQIRTNFMHGEIYYLTGGGSLFLIFKAVHRLWHGRPPVVGSLAMLWGYGKALLSGRSRLVNETEASLYKSMLNRRMAGALSKSAHRVPVPSRSNT